jgi:ATP-dependent DNA helicase RecQ
MRELAGAEAFDALRGLLAGLPQDAWRAPTEPSIERLRRALGDETSQASKLDLAVLLRQALRREDARRSYEVSPRVDVKHPRLSGFRNWTQVGIVGDPIPGGWRATAQVWQPEWLETTGTLGVDDIAAGEEVRRSFNGQDCDNVLLCEPRFPRRRELRWSSRCPRARARA